MNCLCESCIPTASMANYCQECGKKAGGKGVKKVTICDVRKKCDQCLTKAGTSSAPLQLDPDKNLSELSVSDLLVIMDTKFGELEERLTAKFDKMRVELKEEISKEVEKETKAIIEDVKSVKETQKVIKKTILEQQRFLERLRREHSARNVIITGIPKTLLIDNRPTEDATAKMEHILSLLDNSISEDSYEVLKIFDVRQYADGVEKQSIKIQFNDIDTKKSFMKKKVELKSLNSDHPLKKVYINNDEPPLTHKENVRLRSKAYNLRQAGEGAIVLEKGVLTKDGVQVDCFDLSNQLF